MGDDDDTSIDAAPAEESFGGHRWSRLPLSKTSSTVDGDADPVRR